jgi:hypothetical protein
LTGSLPLLLLLELAALLLSVSESLILIFCSNRSTGLSGSPSLEPTGRRRSMSRSWYVAPFYSGAHNLSLFHSCDFSAVVLDSYLPIDVGVLHSTLSVPVAVLDSLCISLLRKKDSRTHSCNSMSRPSMVDRIAGLFLYCGRIGLG